MIEDHIVNRTEKAYFAGIIDGEGTVTLTRMHRKQTPYPEVSVANTNLELLLWLKQRAQGGTIIKKQRKSERHHQAYTWKIQGNKALMLLHKTRNLLIIKQPHADLLLEHYKQLTPRNGKYTTEMLQRKMKLVAEIRKLNSR